MDRPVTLIYNPSAGGGRVEERRPAVEAELRALGIDFTSECTTSLAHAGELARAAADAGRAVFTLGRDGLVGAVAGGLVGSDTPLGVLPGGRGNDFARVLEIPKFPAEAVRAVAGAKTRKLDLAEVDGKPFIGIASCGFDSDANRIANDAKRIKGNLVYLYGALRALIQWKPAAFHPGPRRRGAPVRRLVGRRCELQGLRRRHVHRAQRRARRRTARRRHQRADHQAHVPPRPAPRCSRARTSRSPPCTCTGAARCGCRPTARSRCTPTATRSATCR